MLEMPCVSVGAGGRRNESGNQYCKHRRPRSGRGRRIIQEWPASPAADSGHDFYAVAVGETTGCVLAARHDAPVHFHRDAPIREPELEHELRDRSPGGQIPGFTVDDDVHGK